MDSSRVDKRTDIYSLGVVLAECLTRRPDTNRNDLDAVLKGHPIIEVLLTACAHNAERRFSSAREFATALRPFVASNDRRNQTSFCPNVTCSSALYSEGDQSFRGPLVTVTSNRCCAHCGTELVKSCKKCHEPLPETIRNLVVATNKSERQCPRAHCVHCGTKIFEVPVCPICKSLLRPEDMARRSRGLQNGCSACRDHAAFSAADRFSRPTPQTAPAPSPDDSEIPF